MTTTTRIRRLREQAVRGTTLFGWYYRTRPQALRFLAAPALTALLVIAPATAWGLPAIFLLAFSAAGSFAVFALPFVSEIRALENSAAGLDAHPSPCLAAIAVATEDRVPALPSASHSPQEPEPLPADRHSVHQNTAQFSGISDSVRELIAENYRAGREIVRATSERRDAAWRQWHREAGAERQAMPRGDQGAEPAGNREVAAGLSRSGPAGERTQPSLTDIFGFDPVHWVGPPNTRSPRKR